jgi:AcrR family transcriptional regulator
MRDDDPPTTRDRLLDAAADRFYNQGHGVSIDAIAERAGSKPTVYAHFRSVDASRRRVLQSCSDEFSPT